VVSCLDVDDNAIVRSVVLCRPSLMSCDGATSVGEETSVGKFSLFTDSDNLLSNSKLNESLNESFRSFLQQVAL